MGTLRSFEEVLPPSWPTFLNLIHQPPLPCTPGTVGPIPSFYLHTEPQSLDLGPPQSLLWDLTLLPPPPPHFFPLQSQVLIIWPSAHLPQFGPEEECSPDSACP